GEEVEHEGSPPLTHPTQHLPPDSRFPIPDSRFPVPYSLFPQQTKIRSSSG
ncbi:MAG: hypothetical protein F6K26_36145, partial [Moorea sp. SIO2I5]|nr:hypothetical protein [Moorena sp. SIO2I5]